MAIIPRQYNNRCNNGYGNGCYSTWGAYGRWIALVCIVLAAFFLFFIFACITARRRRRAGMTPYRGTGWLGGPPPGHGPATYTGAQPYYGNNPSAPAPPYEPQPNQTYYGNGNQGYFGGQQSGIELQQPQSAYQPARGGDPVYAPPAGPPPGKKEGDVWFDIFNIVAERSSSRSTSQGARTNSIRLPPHPDRIYGEARTAQQPTDQSSKIAFMTPWRRDSLSSVPATFSSWNSCMAKDYCKWPAIVGIILGALILLSLLWCAIRCLCCGMTCCCSCLSCCDCCCPSGRRGHGSHSRHRDQPASFPPASYHGYQPAPPPPSYEPPKFAQFDVSKRKHKSINDDDALPPMPSWETASSRKVPDQQHGAEEGLEMGRLDPLRAQHAPMLANAAPPPRTGYAEADSSPVPQSPYQYQHQQQAGFQGGDLGSPYGRQQSPTAYTGYASSPPPQGGGNAGYGSRQAYGNPTHAQEPGAYGRGGGGGYGYGQQQAYSAYSAYAPSTSTRYEPTINYQQQTGVVQSARSPPPQQYSNIAGVPPIGRKPVQGSWRDT